jgi:prepilin-type N-terminal cleavage/methylation domain-containing protein/prepilin-type processing-associated H-X9-DG protein
MSNRRFLSARRSFLGFTLIELLVVVAIIALLISILLPSLSKAKEQAKAAVCASRLRGFGQGSAIYEGRFDSYAPYDPWSQMPHGFSGIVWRSWADMGDVLDPPHGFLARFAMEIKPYISVDTPTVKIWETEGTAFAFRQESEYNPETMWEGFFCPSQNHLNTRSPDSPELDITHSDAIGVYYHHGSGYMVNRSLRSACTHPYLGSGIRWPVTPKDSFEAEISKPLADAPDNMMWGASVFQIDIGGSRDVYHLQAVSSDELVNPSDTMYMCDTLDYHTRGSTVVAPFNTGYYDTVNHSPGNWWIPRGSRPNRAATLGARHVGKSSVLYADGSVSRDKQTARNRRGDTIIASTWSDYVPENDDEKEMGNQFHLMPCWRRYGP